MSEPLPEWIAAGYVATRQLPDGRWIGVQRLMFHYTLHVKIHVDGYEDRYCFATRELAMTALRDWDGKGDPIG